MEKVTPLGLVVLFDFLYTAFPQAQYDTLWAVSTPGLRAFERQSGGLLLTAGVRRVGLSLYLTVAFLSNDFYLCLSTY